MKGMDDNGEGCYVEGIAFVNAEEDCLIKGMNVLGYF